MDGSPGLTLPPSAGTAVNRLAARLSAVVTRREVLDVVTDEAPGALGAVMVNISVFDEADTAMLRLISTRDTPPQVAADFDRYPAYGPYPSRDVLTTGRPVLLRSLAERDARYPSLADIPLDLEAFAVLPLVHDRDPLGVVAFGWRAPQDFPPSATADVELVAQLCATALARADLFAAERRARESAEVLTQRLRVLHELTTELARAGDPPAVAGVVLSAAMDAFAADAGSLVTLSADGRHLHQLAARGMPDSPLTSWRSLPLARSPLAEEVVRTGRPLLVRSVPERDARFPSMAGQGVPHEAWANLPLLVRGRVTGLAAFGWRDARDFTPDDVALLTTLAAHTALALDRAELLTQARAVAETLQRALLPGLTPDPPGWQLAARYAPAVEGTQVGGDWYDAFPLPGGRLGLAIGDVMGKGLRAAAVMGSVRAALRAFATVDPCPDVVLTELDAYLTAFGQEELVTCCYAVLDTTTGVLDHSSAGHLPPLVVGADGPRWVDGSTSPPLGAPTDGPRLLASTTVGAGEVLVLYSDGLVEDRHRTLDEGLDELAGAAGGLLGAPDLDASVEQLVGALVHRGPNVDDLAVLAVRRDGDRHDADGGAR